MTLTPISSLESTRKKLFMNSRYIVSRKVESNVFGLRRPNESNAHQFARIGEKNLFMNSRYIMSRKWVLIVFGLRKPK